MAKPTPIQTGPSVGRRVISRRRDTFTLDMTPEEEFDRAVAACRLACEYAKLEEEKKLATKTYGTKLKEIRAGMEQAARAVKNRRHEVDLEVEDVFDFAEDLVYTVRLDTGAIIDKRRPTDADRQESFDFRGAAS